MKRALALLGLAPFVFALLFELLLRAIAPDDLRFRMADRALHCLDEAGPFVFLCPDVHLEFQHPAGFAYDMRTDSSGARDPYDGRSPDGACGEIWLLGDSIMMGYGVRGGDAFASLLAQTLPDWRVRNLAVDSLGTAGILRALERESARSSLAAESRIGPRLFIWNFHASDFLDDARDRERINSSLKTTLFRAQFELAKLSWTYNWARLLVREGESPSLASSLAPEGEADPSDPVFAGIRAIAARTGSLNAQLLFVVYPEIDRETGRPATTLPRKLQAARVASEAGAAVLNLSDAFFAESARTDLYLPEDGHPARGAQAIFYREITPAALDLLPTCSVASAPPAPPATAPAGRLDETRISP